MQSGRSALGHRQQIAIGLLTAIAMITPPHLKCRIIALRILSAERFSGHAHLRPLISLQVDLRKEEPPLRRRRLFRMSGEADVRSALPTAHGESNHAEAGDHHCPSCRFRNAWCDHEIGRQTER